MKEGKTFNYSHTEANAWTSILSDTYGTESKIMDSNILQWIETIPSVPGRNTGINPDDYSITPNVNMNGEFISLTENIAGLINVVGTIILIITIVVLGIKYMVSSIEERAEYKKTMTAILVGAIMLFATTTIINLIYLIIQDNII